MSELQAAEAEPLEAESELAPDSGENHEQNNEVEQEEVVSESQVVANDEPEEPDRFQKAINKKHFQLMEEKRKAQALQDELEKVRSQIPQAQEPQVPDIPSEYDFDTTEQYREAIKARDSKIQERVEWETQQRFRDMHAQQQQAQLQKEQEEKQMASLAAFHNNAKKHGIEVNELDQMVGRINTYGIDPGLGQEIMERPDAGLIVKYLDQNPLELETLNGLSPYKVGAYLETQIAQKAASLKPKLSGAPEPVEPLMGAGTPPKQRGPKGATYT